MVQVCGDLGGQRHSPHASGARGGGCVRRLDAALKATSGGEFACLFNFGQLRAASSSFEQFRAASSSFEHLQISLKSCDQFRSISISFWQFRSTSCSFNQLRTASSSFNQLQSASSSFEQSASGRLGIRSPWTCPEGAYWGLGPLGNALKGPTGD
eukprot:15466280-Alexandrium_andersonii.AAC.1